MVDNIKNRVIYPISDGFFSTAGSLGFQKAEGRLSKKETRWSYIKSFAAKYILIPAIAAGAGAIGGKIGKLPFPKKK